MQCFFYDLLYAFDGLQRHPVVRCSHRLIFTENLNGVLIVYRNIHSAELM